MPVGLIPKKLLTYNNMKKPKRVWFYPFVVTKNKQNNNFPSSIIYGVGVRVVRWRYR